MENLLDEIPLLNVPETGDAPPERLKNPKAGREIYIKYREDDEPNAYNRHLTQDLLDGGLPYDGQNLTENGVDATNLNFGGAEEQLEKARKPYYKLIQSPEKLISLNTRHGSTDERPEWNDILAEEITKTIRGGDDFWFESCRLCDRFIWDGLSFLYWTDARDFRFKSGSLGQFFFERGTKPIETKHDVIPFVEELTVAQLYGYIRNEAAATRNKWNVAAVKKAIAKATSNQPNVMDWEKWSEEIKNNDLSLNKAPRVRLLHLFVKEFNGTISHYITTEECVGDENMEEWLYVCRGKHKSMSSALVMFPYGLGTNSTIHGIRGLGYKIYEIIHQQNRSACRLIDQGMLASSIMFQAKTEEAYGNAGYQTIGNSAMLAPDVEVADVTMPDLQRSVMPALELMDKFLGSRTRGYTAENTFGGDQRKTKYEVEASLEQHAALSDVEQDFFFNPFERAMKESIRRMTWKNYTKLDPGGAEVADLIARLEERGVPREAFYGIDIDSIKVIRLVGAGSAASKTLSLQRLEALRPRMDDIGQANLDRDLAVDAAGSANAERYFPIDRTPRVTLDTSLAILQNHDLLEGKEIPVLPTDRHLAQAREHVKPLLDLYKAYETRQLDEEGVMAEEAVRHQLLYNHTTGHVAQIEGDPATMEEAAGFREILQRVGEIIGNGLKEAQRMAEDAQEENPEAGYSGPSTEDIAKLEQSRAKMRQDQAAHELKMQLMAEESASKRAIADAEAAAKIKRERRVATAKAATDIQVTKAKAAAQPKKPAAKKTAKTR